MIDLFIFFRVASSVIEHVNRMIILSARSVILKDMGMYD